MAVRVKGKSQLWLRARDALQAQPLPGTEYGGFPFWSPDSRYIGFFAEGKLKKIAATGGPAQSLCDAPYGRGGSWSRDNVIIFSPTASGEIRRVSVAGGVAEDVIKPRGLAGFPVFMPDGKHFLYVIFGESVEQNGIYLGSLDGKENRRVLRDVSSVSFAANTLLFVRENALMALPFDPARGQPSGEAMPLAEGVSTNSSFYAPVTASETGLLLYEGRDAAAGGNFQLAWYDRGGKLLGLVGAPGYTTAPAISPDEKSVAFRRTYGSQAALWIRDLTRGVEQRFTTVRFSDLPIWSPKGDHIAFSASSNSSIYNLYQKTVGGTGQDELLLATGTAEYMSQWSRDGRFIVYRENSPNTKWDVWVLPMLSGTERKPIAFLHSEFNEVHPQLSPDSLWMTYTSDESGRREVYLRPFPGGEIQRQISIAGGEQARWRGDGRELFFVSGDGKMMAVPVETMADKKTLDVGEPQPLFDAQLAPAPINVQFEYDVTGDGKRFLLVTNAAGSTSAPLLKVIANWDVGLKK
jgi:Tol biopolymer transport system component